MTMRVVIMTMRVIIMTMQVVVITVRKLVITMRVVVITLRIQTLPMRMRTIGWDANAATADIEKRALRLSKALFKVYYSLGLLKIIPFT